jgi:RHH-type rel operon transcriptional repressor/antitoxin RelB
MLAVRLDKDLDRRLTKLAKESKFSKSHYVRQALERYIEDLEDISIAVYRLNHPCERIPIEEVMKEMGIKV